MSDIGKMAHQAEYRKGLDETSSPSASKIHQENGIEAAVPHHLVAADKLARKLSARQVQMIAIGGTIGTGLFLGTGKSLATGGPASILIAYAIVGAIVFITMLSLGEMAAFVPIAGSFCTFAGLEEISTITVYAIDSLIDASLMMLSDSP